MLGFLSSISLSGLHLITMFFLVATVAIFSTYAVVTFLVDTVFLPVLVSVADLFNTPSVFHKQLTWTDPDLVGLSQDQVRFKHPCRFYEPVIQHAELFLRQERKNGGFWDFLKEDDRSLDITDLLNESPFMRDFVHDLYLENATPLFEWLGDFDPAFGDATVIELELLTAQNQVCKYAITRRTPLVFPLSHMVSPQFEESRLHSALVTIYDHDDSAVDEDEREMDKFIYAIDVTENAKAWFFAPSNGDLSDIPCQQFVLRDVLLMYPFVMDQLSEPGTVKVVFEIQIYSSFEDRDNKLKITFDTLLHVDEAFESGDQ